MSDLENRNVISPACADSEYIREARTTSHPPSIRIYWTSCRRAARAPTTSRKN